MMILIKLSYVILILLIAFVFGYTKGYDDGRRKK